MKLKFHFERSGLHFWRVVLISVLIALTAATALAQDNVVAGSLEDPFATVDSPPAILFDHLTTADGISEGTTLAIVQDEQGFMWFATQYGLDKYDGYQVTVFTHDQDDPNSLSDNDIRALALGRDNTLWVGTGNGGLNRMDRTTGISTRYQHDPDNPSSLSNNYVYALQTDVDGSLWVGTNEGLNWLNPATGVFTRYQHTPDDPTSLSSNRIFALTLAQDGSLWVGTDAGLCHFMSATDIFECFQHQPDNPHSLSNNNVQALYRDSTGIIWAGTEQGLNALDTATGSFTRYLHNPNNPLSISSDIIHAIYEDRGGRLWLGTRNGGLNVFNRTLNIFTSYQNDPENPGSISGNTIGAIFQDTSGILWMGTWANDLNYVAPSQHKFPSIFAIRTPISMQADGGRLWVGTLEDGLFAIDLATKAIQNFVHDPDNPHSLPDNAVFALYLDRAGQLWVATESGLSRYNAETGQFDRMFSELATDVGLHATIIRTMLEDSQGQLWLGTQNGLFCVNPVTKKFDCYSREGNAGQLSTTTGIYALVEDTTGMIWLGTQFGLYRLNPAAGKVVPYNKGTPGLSNSIVAILLDGDSLWLTTWGSGLYHYNPSTGQIAHYTRKNGLPGDLIPGIEQDIQGRLWLSTSSGLALFNPADETVRTYDQMDGLPEIDFNQGAISQSDTGELYFGTSKHVIAFRPEDIVDNPFVPPVVLTGFQLFNKPVTPGSDSPLKQLPGYVTDLTLNYDQSVFSFEYAALNYAASGRNQYAYKMEGFDADWNEVGHRRMATYTNLKPGSYTFRVKASNNDGVWNETGLTVRLTITPPWWQTWWAYSLYAVIAVTAIFGYSRYRSQAHARELAHERRLRETIQRVDRSKDEERTRIAREMHDGLAQTLAGLRFRIRTWQNLMTRDPALLSSEINDVGGVLADTLQELHRIIFALRPVVLNDMGLFSSVTQLAETLRKQNPIEIHTDMQGDESGLSEALEHATFRLVQEALNNAVRHARAGQIWVKVKVDAGVIDIEVRDDGAGFDTALLEQRARQGHQGILNIRERAALFNGSAEIISAPGQGTTLRARLFSEKPD